MGVKHNIDLSVNIGKLKLKNPIITASGTFGYADEFEEYVNVSSLGAIVTKGITLHPRKGNPQPRVQDVNNGLINRIGLENMGIYPFIEQKLPILRAKNISFIINIAGSSEEEYVQLAKICQNKSIEAIEMNLSCPNVKHGCLEFGKDPDTLYRLISNVREAYQGTLIVKLTSNVSYPTQIAKLVQKAGANAISAINTVKAMHVSLNYNNSKFEKTTIQGGLSGPAIKPIALSFISEIRPVVDIPIIGMGGITYIQDVLEFLSVGANAVQIGTANFTHPTISEQLVDGLGEILIKNNKTNLKECFNRRK